MTKLNQLSRAYVPRSSSNQRAGPIVRLDAVRIGLPAKEKGRVTKGGQDSGR